MEGAEHGTVGGTSMTKPAARRLPAARRAAARPQRSGPLQAVRVAGWLCMTTGTVILLYLVYSLLFTGLTTSAAQDDFLEEWQLEVGPVEAALPGESVPPPAAAATPVAVDPDEAVAVLEFFRPGSPERPVADGPLFVVEGVGVADLRRGPGHYPGTALPGTAGNFAVAGHRTTYGAPFFNLDQLAAGDEIRVSARSGATFDYRVVERRVVRPSENWVIGSDPLGRGRPLLTLTTCEPRFSDAERLVVFAELL